MRDAIAVAAPYLLAAALAFGPVAAWLANRRLRNPAIWLVLGAITGPIGIGILLAAPAGRCPACGVPTRGFGSVCLACGTAVRGAAEAVVPAIPHQAALRVAPDDASTLAARAPQFTAVGPGPALDGQVDRLAAVGARRPVESPVIRTSGTVAATEFARSLPGSALGGNLTVLAIGVFVRGTESLLPGARYLIARSESRLLIIGPVEPSPEHIELDLPLDEVEATFVPDRLVVSGWTERRTRRWVLAFQSLAGLTASAIDEALMASPARFVEAAGR